MQSLTKLSFGLVALVLATACKKEVEIITVPVDKVYSWAEVKQLNGSMKIIVQVAKAPSSLYLQEVEYFGTLTPQPQMGQATRNFPYCVSYSFLYNPLPTDVRNRIPMNSHFYVNPVQNGDTLLRPYPTTYQPPANNPGDISLHRLDPAATQFINRRLSPYFSFGAINSNDYLLVGYATKLVPDNAMHFVLSKLSSAFVGSQVTSTSRVVSVPLSTPTAGYAITAMGDYFLVDCLNMGIFKIRQDGTARQVFSGSTGTTTFYKWQGTLYAVQSDGKNGLLTSTDEGETWQYHSNTPDYFHFSNFYPVGDSLVGMSHGVATNSLYTLRWQGNNYRVRELKNDGLGQADFSDLAQLGDTVYLGTSNGLFKRPLNKFFESK